LRLDNFLVKNNLTDSRTKAQVLIKDSKVIVNDKIVLKSAFKIDTNDKVTLKEHDNYVSRASYKLKSFLEE